jgi:hypothetical protein
VKADRLHDRVGRLAERVLPHLEELPDAVRHEHDGGADARDR